MMCLQLLFVYAEIIKKNVHDRLTQPIVNVSINTKFGGFDSSSTKGKQCAKTVQLFKPK